MFWNFKCFEILKIFWNLTNTTSTDELHALEHYKCISLLQMFSNLSTILEPYKYFNLLYSSIKKPFDSIRIPFGCYAPKTMLSKSSDIIWKMQEEFLNLTMRDSVGPISWVYPRYITLLIMKSLWNTATKLISNIEWEISHHITQKKNQRTTCENVTKQTEYRNNFNNYNSVSMYTIMNFFSFQFVIDVYYCFPSNTAPTS
jgi:hypothetical protein